MTKMVLMETDSRGVATVTLNNADKHNAFDDQLIAQISATFEALESDPAIRIVILQAAGRSCVLEFQTPRKSTYMLYTNKRTVHHDESCQ